ncbi:MAG: hypothetical protein DMF53_05740 [Acidobacteria bacterium]|nr:MAG: hypothetical protein DMF53_05740 [Acidobacteriota bacterium]
MLSHPSEDEIGRFLASRLEPAGERRVARHILGGCGVCSRELVDQAPERLLDQADERRRRKAAFTSERDRALAAALRQEARWKPDERKLARTLELLQASPRGYDGLTPGQVRSLQGSSLAEALLLRSAELRFSDPRAIPWLAYNAAKVAESLRPEEADPAYARDLQAKAWGEMANAFRITERYGEAEAALGRSRALLRRGTGDPRLLAWLAGPEATLREAQRRMAECHELRLGTYRLHLRSGDRHLAGKALLSLGGGMEYDHRRRRQGIRLIREALSLIDPDREPQLLQVGQHTLMTLLAVSGEHREAGGLLLRSGLRRAFASLPLNLVRLRWLEGKILAGGGQAASAERAFWEVRGEFLDVGREHLAALVGLDLLAVLLRQRKQREVRELAGKVYGTFRDLGLREHAAQARLYLA